MDLYKVSVVLPSYNVKDYIKFCLNSVCHQSLGNIEIICVDAGSTDGTEQIIKEYALKDKRIKILHCEKKSYGYQVNLGIRVAKGKYIAILETDDFIDSDMYESLYKIAENKECDYVKANYRFFFTDSEGIQVFWNSDTLSKNKNDYDKIFRICEMKNINRYDTNVWSGIYRRDFIIKNNIEFNESSGAAFQDIGFLQQIFWKADKVYYAKRAYYNYCTDREDSSTNYGNGLKFSYQEYHYLLSKKISENQNVNCIYERMADVFEENLKKVIMQKKFEENIDIIQWFIDILWRKQKEGIIFRPYLEELVEDKNNWIDQYRQTLTRDKLNKRNLFNQLNGEIVIIFGAGVRGKTAYQEFDYNNVNVMGFCDNNQDLWGKNIGAKRVYNLQEVEQRFSNAKYVIANKVNSFEIKKQLIESGVKDSDIFIWRTDE